MHFPMRPMRVHIGPVRLGRAVIAHALVAAAGFSLGVLTDHFAVAMLVTVVVTLAAHIADQARQRRRTDSLERRYRTLVEELPLITYIDSPDTADQSANYISPQITEVLGYAVEDWVTIPNFYVDHLHPADRDRVRERQRAARESGEPLELEYRFLAQDGRVVWLRDSYTIVRDDAGKPWYTQGFAVDITAAKETERYRDELLRQAQLQNNRLLELDRMKDELVALVSHELRTPLTSIRGYLELLLEEAPEAGIAPTHVEWLNIIDRNAVRLLRLVEDLLLKAQDAAGAITLDRIEVDITAVVEHCIQAGIPVATARGIALAHETEKLEPVSADPVRIGQVIDNLVSNALKFTPAGGRVDVRAFAHGAGVRIEVADTGVGIPEDEQERLFERFYRTAQAQSAAVPGAGLGLSIAKAIVEGHGGAISCRSADGGGTTFIVDLPLAESVASAA
jgi:PAS domain S-box-containing protein